MYIALVIVVVAGIIIGIKEMPKGLKGTRLQGLQDNGDKKDTINKKNDNISVYKNSTQILNAVFMSKIC